MNDFGKLLTILGISNIDFLLHNISQAQSVILGGLQIVSVSITLYYYIKNKRKNNADK